MLSLSLLLCVLPSSQATLPSSSRIAAAPYDLIVFEPDGGGMFAATAVSDVNDLGLVVGMTVVNGGLVHFEWTAGGGVTFPTHLPPGGDRRVNNRGDSVFLGGSSSYPGTPDLVLADGTHVPIPAPLGGETLSGKNDVNDDLVVIGQGVSTGTTSGVFYWSPSTGSLGVLIDAARTLRRVSANGLGVGNRIVNGTLTKAYVVELETQSWVDLHALLPGPPGASEAFDVNDRGTVVGIGPDGSSLSAWVWSPRAGFTFLPGLAGGPTMYVRPRAIDNEGRVVGTALTAEDEYHAFLWEPWSGMTDLHELAAGNGTFRLVEALDISETGVIIGRGFHGPVWGPDRAFVLKPTGGMQTDSRAGTTSPSASGPTHAISQ
jgi:probable HAF family extracellular repeat protein